MTTVILDNAKLLNRYFDRRALSQLPNQAPFFQLGKIQWASDLIEMIDGKPSVIQTIDSNLSALKSVFFTNDAVYTYKDGVILVRCTIPPNTIPEGESYQFSAIGILDDLNGLVAVAGTQPVYVYSDRGLVVEIKIKTNIA